MATHSGYPIAGDPNNPHPVGSRQNPIIAPGANSQAGLASTRARYGGPANIADIVQTEITRAKAVDQRAREALAEPPVAQPQNEHSASEPELG